MTSKTQHIDFANKLLHNVHKYKSEKDWSHLLIPKKYNVSGHSAVFQKSMVDQNETLLQKPFPLFSEEVNAHLEQLNETVYYNDPVLVAFTLTTDHKTRLRASEPNRNLVCLGASMEIQHCLRHLHAYLRKVATLPDMEERYLSPLPFDRYFKFSLHP